MTIDQIILLIIFLVLIGIALYHLFRFLQGKNAGTDLEEEEFSKDLRRVQVIDIRETDEFNAEHILGARNIPYSQFKMRMPELRKDMPVYLYGSNKYFANRASLLLKNEGYQDIYRLKGGYDAWNGRIKRKK